jgi:hypothetical protein
VGLHTGVLPSDLSLTKVYFTAFVKGLNEKGTFCFVKFLRREQTHLISKSFHCSRSRLGITKEFLTPILSVVGISIPSTESEVVLVQNQGKPPGATGVVIGCCLGQLLHTTCCFCYGSQGALGLEGGDSF